MPKQVNVDGPKKPSDAEFEEAAIEAAVRGEVLKHYAHLGGWVVTLLSGVATAVGLLSNPGGWVITGCTAALALGSLCVNYGFRFDSYKKRYIKGLLDRRQRADRELISALRTDCEQAMFARGSKEADDLWNSYEILVRVLDQNAKFNDPEAQRYRSKAETLYLAGVINLRKARDLYQVTCSPPLLEDVQAELAQYEKARRRANSREAEAIERQITLAQKRIIELSTKREDLENRLLGANEIEANLQLQAARLSELGIGDTDKNRLDWKEAAAKLDEAIRSAVESDEEFKQALTRE